MKFKASNPSQSLSILPKVFLAWIICSNVFLGSPACLMGLRDPRDFAMRSWLLKVSAVAPKGRGTFGFDVLNSDSAMGSVSISWKWDHTLWVCAASWRGLVSQRESFWRYVFLKWTGW